MSGEEGYENPEIIAPASWLASSLENPDIVILDMRSPLEYMFGHIPGAILVKYEQIAKVRPGQPFLELISKEEAEKVFGSWGISNDKTVVAYGDGGSAAAARLFWTLEYFGATAKILEVDFREWARRGYAVSRERVRVEPATFTAKPDPAKQADAGYILSKLNTPEVKLIDSRSPLEYSGQMSAGLRGGRIPGAVNIEWLECVGEGGRVFKPASQLKKIFESRRVEKRHEVITYCLVGERAAHTYVALRLLGYPKLRLYDRSFSEWGNNPSLPI